MSRLKNVLLLFIVHFIEHSTFFLGGEAGEGGRGWPMGGAVTTEQVAGQCLGAHFFVCINMLQHTLLC